jgi:hypothetical protein
MVIHVQGHPKYTRQAAPAGSGLRRKQRGTPGAEPGVPREDTDAQKIF